MLGNQYSSMSNFSCVDQGQEAGKGSYEQHLSGFRRTGRRGSRGFRVCVTVRLRRTLTCTSHTLAVMLDVTSTPPGIASSAPVSAGPRVTPAALSAAAFAFSLSSDSSSSLFCCDSSREVGVTLCRAVQHGRDPNRAATLGRPGAKHVELWSAASLLQCASNDVGVPTKPEGPLRCQACCMCIQTTDRHEHQEKGPPIHELDPRVNVSRSRISTCSTAACCCFRLNAAVSSATLATKALYCAMSKVSCSIFKGSCPSRNSLRCWTSSSSVTSKNRTCRVCKEGSALCSVRQGAFEVLRFHACSESKRPFVLASRRVRSSSSPVA